MKTDDELLYDSIIEEANQRLLNALAQLKEARQIHKAFMALGKELSTGADRNVLLGIICEAVESLFPQAYYLVQLIETDDAKSVAWRFKGPLHTGVHTRIHLTEASARKTGLTKDQLGSSVIKLHDSVPHLFHDSQHAIHVPLVSERQLFGAIQVEAPEGLGLGDDDELLLISLANQMALALRNQRLLEETRYLKEYMESILEHANALILVTDTNRQVLVFNETAARVLGFSKQEVIGQDLLRLVPAEDSELLADEISHLIEGKPSDAGMEVHLRNREGQLVQIVFHLALLKDQAGSADSIILVGQDLTPMRRLERQIIEAEKMASLGKLAAGIVHELNNPLTSISVYAEYVLKKLEAGKLDSTDVEKVRKILEGANRIQKLTRDLVSYSRPAEEEPEMVDLNEVVRQGMSFCEHTIRKCDIVANIELGNDLPPLMAIRNQLLQVVINLVTNACQAMEGGGELTVSTARQGDNLVLQVADTGVGIPEKNLSRLFEPFFTTKKSGQGTGLGLSIVARIVEHHRGRIKVESSSGKGTVFDITLPLGDSKNHESEHA